MAIKDDIKDCSPASQSTLPSMASEDILDSRSATSSDEDASPKAKATQPEGSVKAQSPHLVEQNVDPNLWHIHGHSYDLSQFVDKHPGGRLAILTGKGRDCTALFESYHPWNDKHRKVLKAYGPPPPAPDPFYEELKQGIRKKFPGGLYSTKMRLRTKVCLSLGWCLMMTLFFIVRTPLSCAAAGVLMATVGTRMAHEGAHFQVSRHEWVNRLSQFLGYFLTGPSMAWMYRHTISHHAHTNQEHDVDVEHIWIADMFPGWVKILALPFLPIGAMVEIGAKFLFVDLLVKRSVGGNLIVDRTLGYTVPEVITWLTVHCFLGPSWWCYLAMFWTAGAIFVPMSQVAHIIVFPDHKKYDSWAKMQIAESVDFAADSDFWFHLAFGLTTQVEHHLFPGIGHHCYGECREVVKEVCKKNGVTYYDVTAKKALGALWRRLVDGQPCPLA
mmetsp:Transcript_77575/g.199743  ORF Transcript_77575/g.199743 Transcript_77575/m.199743 type:complete len:443 (-) Transcript_77575:433-1761(-)